MSEPAGAQILMKPAQAASFQRYGEQRGHKRSTLIAPRSGEHPGRGGYIRSRADRA